MYNIREDFQLKFYQRIGDTIQLSLLCISLILSISICFHCSSDTLFAHSGIAVVGKTKEAIAVLTWLILSASKSMSDWFDREDHTSKVSDWEAYKLSFVSYRKKSYFFI